MQSQADLLMHLEAEVGKSKEYLTKVVKSGGGGGDASAWATVQGDEELLLSGVGMGMSALVWDD